MRAASHQGSSSSAWIRRLSRWGGPLILALGLAVLFAPFLFAGRHAVSFQYEWGSSTGLPEGGDPAACSSVHRWHDASLLSIHYPNAVLTARALHGFHLPTWNPFVGCGMPAFGNGQTFPLNPFLWPFYLLPNPWMYTASLLLICLWGAAGVYLWLGAFDLPPWAQGFGASLWLLNPWVTQFFTLSDVWAGAWFGWLAWAWDRAIRDERAWWLPAVFVTGMVLCGHPEVALLLALASGLYALISWSALGGGARIPFKAFVPGALGATTLAVALTAVHWLPLILRSTESLPYKFIAPEALLRSPGRAADLLSPRSAVYLAPAVLALAFTGALRPGRSRRLWPALALLGVGLLGYLQPPPLGFLAEGLTLGGLVPGFYYRSVLWFGLLPAIAAGVSALVGGQTARRWPASACLAPTLVYGIAFASGWIGSPGWAWLLLQGSILAIMGAAAIWTASLAVKWAAALALVLVALDPFVLLPGCVSEESAFALKNSASACYGRFTRLDPARQDPTSWSAARTLTKEGHGRMWAGAAGPEASVPFMAPNLSAAWGVRDARVQDVLLGRRMAVLHETLRGGARSHYFASLNYPEAVAADLALLGVSYVARPTGLNSGRFKWETVPGALSRAYLVHAVAPAATEADSARLWQEWLRQRDRFRGGAIVEGWQSAGVVGATEDGDAVTWLEDGDTRLRFRAASSKGALLVVLDAYAEGWVAKVDGVPTALYPANLAFRAVALPSGTHEVTMDYRAPGLVRGGVLSIIGCLAVALVTWTRRGGGIALPTHRERAR